jgi:protein-histidine pros-kinase
LTARAQGGQETMVSYNASTFHDRDGKLQGVFAAARDVTERKLFEQALQEKNLEMENANLAKDRFLASMSHELRTPLNAIIGFTGTLLMRLPGPLTADQDKQLKTIQTSGRHLLSLINDLLDVAKIESGNVELDAVPVVCQEVVKEVLDTLITLAQQKGLTLRAETPPLPITLQTDRRALNQILLNFVNNAIKFTDTGDITLRLVQRMDNGRLVTQFAVSDSGVGIRAEDQPKLFHAFSQLDAGSTRRYEGTGLGLYLSQKLARLIDGQLSFTSEYGQGSTFVLELAVKQP